MQLLQAAGAPRRPAGRGGAGGTGDPLRHRPARIRAAGLPRRALAGDAAVLLVRGKGGKERIVPLSDPAREAAAALVARQGRRPRKAAGCSPAATRATR